MEQRDLFSADSYTEAKDLVSPSAGLCELLMNIQMLQIDWLQT